MVNVLRRLFWLALLGGAGYAGWALWSSTRKEPTGAPDGAADWPPLDPPVQPARQAQAAAAGAEPATVTVAGFAELPDADAALPTADADLVVADPGADPAATWVASTDGQCPLTHPVKANDNSGIYHLPGGRFYDRTGAERCYVTPEAAEADGYRRSRS